MKLQIDRMLVCSTTHLKPEDDEMLFNEQTSLVVYAMEEYGYLILAKPMHDRPRNYSDNLFRLLEFARKQDCDWLRLDPDASAIDGLPVYQW